MEAAQKVTVQTVESRIKFLEMVNGNARHSIQELTAENNRLESDVFNLSNAVEEFESLLRKFVEGSADDSDREYVQRLLWKPEPMPSGSAEDLPF